MEEKYVGGWLLSRKLGSGGNGDVFEARKAERTAAIKILRKSKPKILRRFNDEILAMQKCRDIPGVLPIFACAGRS